MTFYSAWDIIWLKTLKADDSFIIFSIKPNRMLADYVMKSIDSLFSDKLFPSGHSQLHKAPPASFCPKRSFNK